MNVLITGATGFVGRATVAELGRRGHTVTAIVRPTSDTTGLGCATVVADLEDAAGLRPLIAAADVVVHAAGGGRAPTPEALFRSNTATTRALVDASERLHRFVLVSSVAARGPLGGSGPVTAYGRSKQAAEAALAELPAGTATTVLRPPGVVGPGDDRMLGLFRLAALGVVPFPAGQRAASFVYVDCCARAIADAVTSEGSGQVHYPADGRAWTPREIADAVGAAVGRRPAIVRIPRWSVHAAARVATVLPGRRFLTRDKATEITQADWSCDPSSLTAALGWRPQVDLIEGARRTAVALRADGRLPQPGARFRRTGKSAA